MRDIIEANHVYLKMLEEHKKSGSLNVQCKKKKRRQPKKKKASRRLTKAEKEAKEQLDREFERRVEEQTEKVKSDAWESHSNRVAALVQGAEEMRVESDELLPFDFVATSDSEFDAQKDTVVEKIQHLLVGKGKPDDSIALFREARFLFANEPSLFGRVGLAPDEEFDAYKALIMKRLSLIPLVLQLSKYRH